MGGTGTAEPQTVEKGTKITLPSGEGMKKDGYKFLGWSLTENGEIITEYTATGENVTFFAIWKQAFKVEFDT
ncbi:MAG: InlB B-repeat-containing protein, partial [Treponema sp.]|nr:InlB B-repeat-containing protein [Treponema sp.]